MDENLRKLPACERCRVRKTKCDSGLPACKNCAKAGVECINNDRALGRTIVRSYVSSLEERIEALESHEGRVRKNDEPPSNSDHVRKKAKPVGTQKVEQVENPSPTPPVSPTHEKDASASPIGTLMATTLIGETTETTIFSNEDEFSSGNPRELFIQNENTAINKLGRDLLRAARRNITKNKATDLNEYDPSLICRIAKRYFTWMGSAYPVLHESIFHLQLEKYFSRSKETSNTEKFQINMVLAVSLASISRPHFSVSEIGRLAHSYYRAATKLLGKALHDSGLAQVQNILLLLQYALIVPKSGNLWQLSGTAMRFVSEMGLYTEHTPVGPLDPLTLDLRRRVFWSCYCIDRMLSTVMGRPTNIPDNWINAELPAIVEDKFVTVNDIGKGPICQLKVAQHRHIEITRLQSKIHSHLYDSLASKCTEDLTTWSWKRYDELRVWRQRFTYSTPLVTKEWTELQFHLTVILLFRPSPLRPSPSEEALHVAFHSAGQAIKLIRTMHRDHAAAFSWLTIHNLFMCGITLLNSLKEFSASRNKLCIPFVEIFLQIQACSAMLETLSALDPGRNERIRNAFDDMSSSILKQLQHVSTSENSDDCIFYRISQYDGLTIPRPTNIEGMIVPVEESPVKAGTSVDHPGNEKHFYHHDIDASYNNERPIDRSLYIGPKGTWTHNNNNDALNNALVTSDGKKNEQGANSLGPLDQNIDAELERWFLHPFVELSSSFGDDQF